MIFIFKNVKNIGLTQEVELITVEMDFMPCPVFKFRGGEIVPHPENPSYVRGSLSDVIVKLRSNGYGNIDEVKEVKIVAELREVNSDHLKTIIDELSDYEFRINVSLF